MDGHAGEDVEKREAEMPEEEKQGRQPEFVGAPMEMRNNPLDQRMYAHQSVHDEQTSAWCRCQTFQDASRSCGWFRVCVNFNTVIVFHAVCSHFVRVRICDGLIGDMCALPRFARSFEAYLRVCHALFRNLKQNPLIGSLSSRDRSLYHNSFVLWVGKIFQPG